MLLIILELVLLDMDVAQPTHTCRLQKELVHLLKLIPVLRVPPEQSCRLRHLFLMMKSVVNYVLLDSLVLKSVQVVNHVHEVHVVRLGALVVQHALKCWMVAKGKRTTIVHVIQKKQWTIGLRVAL